MTRAPAEAKKENLEALRRHGLSDTDIFVLTHIVGFFNHINRVADALGVDLEEGMPPKPVASAAPGRRL